VLERGSGPRKGEILTSGPHSSANRKEGGGTLSSVRVTGPWAISGTGPKRYPAALCLLFLFLSFSFYGFSFVTFSKIVSNPIKPNQIIL
jgi:hypothetical protein